MTSTCDEPGSVDAKPEPRLCLRPTLADPILEPVVAALEPLVLFSLRTIAPGLPAIRAVDADDAGGVCQSKLVVSLDDDEVVVIFGARPVAEIMRPGHYNR